MAMGFDSLSMNATNLPKVKWLLRQLSLAQAGELLGRILDLEHPQATHALLQQTLRDLGLGRMLNPVGGLPA
jgi:phosphotransferase system enzyme I (PtsP)